MNFQAAFKTLLNPLVSGGAWAKVAPDGTLAPYIVYGRVTSSEENTLDDNGGSGNEENTLMQIDVWGKTYAEAQAKAGAVKAAMKSWATENIKTGDQDDYEPDTKLHRVILEYSIWHK